MKTVFVSGRFDQLHSGHLRLLAFAKSVLGDYLVVGLHTGNYGSEHLLTSYEERFEALIGTQFVDQIVPVSKSIEKILGEIKPQIVLKGREFASQDNPEEEWCAQNNADLIFSSGNWHDYVSEPPSGTSRSSSLDYTALRKFLIRSQMKASAIEAIMNRIKTIRIGVIGDIILDEYQYCEPIGMSREEPALVLRPFSEKRFLGGAGIVAAHIAEIGAQVKIFTVVGDDPAGHEIMQLLDERRLEHDVTKEESRVSTLKTRYKVQGASAPYSLFKVSRLSDSDLMQSTQEQLVANITNSMDELDLIIFSDFNYGVITDHVLQTVIKIAKEKGIIMAADSQSSSQVGDIGRFVGVDLIFATEHEVRVSLKNKEDGLVTIARDLLLKTEARGVFLKLGSDGALLHRWSDQISEQFSTEKLSALNKNPKDVSGAGDSFLALASAAFCLGGMREALLLGSLAAALQVATEGNRGIEKQQVMKALAEL